MIEISFDEKTHSIDALYAAAYRVMSLATCEIGRADGNFLCRLLPKSNAIDCDSLRSHFIDLVTDEKLRERLSVKTEPVRNLILALAFGFLTKDQKT